MTADRCPTCDRPHAESLPAPAGTCGHRAACRYARSPEAPCGLALDQGSDYSRTRDDCTAYRQDWRARAQAVEAVLRAVEWRGQGALSGLFACPSCGRAQAEGHAADCRLAAALKGTI